MVSELDLKDDKIQLTLSHSFRFNETTSLAPKKLSLMGASEYTAKIGEDKLLVLHIDNNKEPDKEFIKSFEQAANTNPKSIQEFFITLNELQKAQPHQQTDIQLKNLKVYDRLSEETIAFSADLYINNIKAGVANNSGKGGNTMYLGHHDTGRVLIKQAEEWCKNQPPEILKDVPTKGNDIIIPQSLDNYIDTIVSNFQKDKNLQLFNRRLNRDSQCSIVFGVPGKHYKKCTFPLPLEAMLETEKGKVAVMEALDKIVYPKMEAGEKILNTNIPEDMLLQNRKRFPDQRMRQTTPNKKGKRL